MLPPFTRSYIFSQTIFSMRAGVDNRLHGWIIAVVELSLFFLPISIIQYLVSFGIARMRAWCRSSCTALSNSMHHYKV